MAGRNELPHPEFTIDRHAEITERANRGYLDDERLGQVVLANILQDLDQFESKIHFDNCTFPQGAGYIAQQWQGIEAQDELSEVTLTAFGRLTHTVQDFYSHSNWIELHLQDDPVPIWDLDVGTLPADIVSGTWWIGFPKECPAGAPTHGELNKDDPSSPEGRKVVESGPNAGQTYFELAFDAAIRATELQFDRLKRLGRPLGESLLAGPPWSFEDLVSVAAKVSAIKDGD